MRRRKSINYLKFVSKKRRAFVCMSAREGESEIEAEIGEEGKC